MPREAVEVTIGGETRVMGRQARDRVQWNEVNQFRPLDDVDEIETRAGPFSQDWVYLHWKDAPFTAGARSTVRYRLIDHDLWLGRVHALNRDGASIVYMTDAHTVTHWNGRARNEWGLQGLAMWSLGQEDVRTWEALEGGLLPPETKRLDE